MNEKLHTKGRELNREVTQNSIKIKRKEENSAATKRLKNNFESISKRTIELM